VKLALLLLATGCALEPKLGAPTHEACTNTDTDPGHAVSFARDIVPILDEYHCADCHTPAGKTPIGLIVGGLDLTSYATLRAGGVRSMAQIVVAGDACSSVLLQKLEAGPPYGSRMPLSGPEYLDDEDLELISDWIVEGGHDN
jgi:mono/diheme cytochrome c family protein